MGFADKPDTGSVIRKQRFAATQLAKNPTDLPAT
jgi:hypothetical protein